MGVEERDGKVKKGSVENYVDTWIVTIWTPKSGDLFPAPSTMKLCVVPVLVQIPPELQKSHFKFFVFFLVLLDMPVQFLINHLDAFDDSVKFLLDILQDNFQLIRHNDSSILVH